MGCTVARAARASSRGQYART
ncbi:hypothetical protein LEMLEM_LOCUS9308 [Lemmus lemmus]